MDTVDNKENGGWPLVFRSTMERQLDELHKQYEEKMKGTLRQFQEVYDLAQDAHNEVHAHNLRLIMELSRLSGVSLVEETLPNGFKVLSKNSGMDIVDTFHNKRRGEG